jgi:hypothetical protein
MGFMKRAREKGSEKDTSRINNSAVPEHMEGGTKKAYKRQVDNQYE